MIMIINKIKLLLGSLFWLGGCITLAGLLISAATFSSTLTEWSGDSKFWSCLTGWSNPIYDTQTLDAFVFWIFILAQFLVAIVLFVSVYRSCKKHLPPPPEDDIPDGPAPL